MGLIEMNRIIGSEFTGAWGGPPVTQRDNRQPLTAFSRRILDTVPSVDSLVATKL